MAKHDGFCGIREQGLCPYENALRERGNAIRKRSLRATVTIGPLNDAVYWWLNTEHFLVCFRAATVPAARAAARRVARKLGIEIVEDSE